VVESDQKKELSLELPDDIAEKTSSFPESSYGACTVTLVLRDGRQIKHVALAWNTAIAKIGGSVIRGTADLDFHMTDIVDVFPGD
jgi:hypothetical protein